MSSRNNPLVKWAAGLSEKKNRTEAKAFMVEGEKLTSEAIRNSLPITHIFISESRCDEIMTKLTGAFSTFGDLDCEIITLSDGAFEKISTEKAPEGVITVIKYLDFFKYLDIIYKEEFFLAEDERAIALSSVRDPGNLGAVIRSAVAFGVDHIILSADSADIYNPKTVRSAMGALFGVKVTVVRSLCDFIISAQNAGRRVFAAELRAGAVSLSDTDILKGDIFMIGNEGHGISEEISTLCDKSVFIPISNKTESLNASVAAAVFMWEQNKII